MDEYQHEKEQIENIRAWWSENGNYVIGGAILGIALLVGWTQWRTGISTSQLEASSLYESLMSDVGGGEMEAAESKATDLYDNYASTAYPAQARLAMARLYMDKGRDQDAADALNGLIESDASPAIRAIGRLRLAKVLLYQDKPDEVVQLLAEVPDSALRARYNDVLGDAYVALGQYDDAADAYAIALADNSQVSTIDRNLVQMKIDDLPGTDADTEIAEVGEDDAPDDDGDAVDDADDGTDGGSDATETADGEPEE